ncbi:MAG: hypothetical protein ACP5SH_18265, partial [Syntrophobacteraceae bacterium]
MEIPQSFKGDENVSCGLCGVGVCLKEPFTGLKSFPEALKGLLRISRLSALEVEIPQSFKGDGNVSCGLCGVGVCLKEPFT